MAAPSHFVLLAALLLFCWHKPCLAAEQRHAASVLEAEEAPAELMQEAMSEKENAEFEALQAEIMSDLSDDKEPSLDGEEDDNANKRWHVYGGRPFLEYNGFLEEDHASLLEEGHESNIHKATMNMDEAKKFCGESEVCAGFTHAGGPTEGPVEMFFKSTWALSVDGEDTWTSYQKGEKMSHIVAEEEAEKQRRERAFHCQIQTCSG